MDRELYNSLRKYHLFADSVIKLMHRWCTQSVVQGDTAMVAQLNSLISVMYKANSHIAWQREIIRARTDPVPPESNLPIATDDMSLNLAEASRHLTETERAVGAMCEYINSLAGPHYVTSKLWVKCCRMLMGAKVADEIAEMRAAIQRAG